MAKKWTQGKIIIKLQDDKFSYEVGDVVRGTVILEQQAFYPGHELQVGMDGAEFTYFKGEADENKWHYSGKNNFLHAMYPLQKYEDKKAPMGNSSFTFAFRIADWLPQTCIHASDHRNLSMKRTYCVVA